MLMLLLLLLLMLLLLLLRQDAINTAKIYFDHEKLIAYQRRIQFVCWASRLLEHLPAKLAVADQLEISPYKTSAED